MEITLLYFEGCPNWKVADERLTQLRRERPDITVERQRVETPEEAARLGFRGSPSILVDGVDAFAGTGDQSGGEAGVEVGLSCRRYATSDGYEGAPPLEQLRAALADG